MHSCFHGIRLVLTGLLLTLLVSCDVDILGLDTKTISGSYALEHFLEGDAYYLVDRFRDQQGGVLEAITLRIGVNERAILCDVRKQFRGDPDGLYSIQLSTGKIHGPLTLAEVAANPDLRDLTLQEVRTFFAEMK